MEQGGISIISPPGITENSIGKPTKNIGLALRSNAGIRSAKEKLKAPCEWNYIKFDRDSIILVLTIMANGCVYSSINDWTNRKLIRNRRRLRICKQKDFERSRYSWKLVIKFHSLSLMKVVWKTFQRIVWKD